MAWRPIAGSPPQIDASDGTLASGYFLKFYASGTTTPINMATDSTGGTTLAKCQINASGYPINGSSAVFIPYIDQKYRLVLYTNATDADANTFGNADWDLDAIDYAADIRDELANTSNAAQGDALIGVLRTEANAEATTQHAINETRPIQVGADYGATLSRTNGTDDWYTALTNLNSDISTDGATVIIPPGTYDFDTELEITAPSFKRVCIIAYGAEFVTSGAFAGIKITGSVVNGGVSIYGLKINHRGNTTATAGFHISGAWNTRLYDCQVEAHGVSATYAAILCENATAADDSTGAIWTKIHNFWCRKRSGGDSGEITYGVQLKGAANAVTITGGGLNNCTTAIHSTIHSGQTTLPNALVIQDVAFENFTTGIHIEGAATSAIAGPRIVNNRFEDGTTAISFTGTTTQPARPPFLAGNDMASDVTTYLNNPNSLVINSLDMSTTPDYGSEAMTWRQNTTIIARDGSSQALSVKAIGGSRGQVIQDSSGNTVVGLYWTGSGQGGRIVGNTTSTLELRGIKSISANGATSAQNLRGQVTFATSGTATVTFGTAESDATYFIAIAGDANETFYVTSKTTSGFTMNSSNASSTATVDWILIR